MMPRELTLQKLTSGQIYQDVCRVLAGQAAGVEWGRYSEEDWAALALLAEAQGAAPLVYRAWRSGGWRELLPGAARQRLERAYYTSAAQNALILLERDRLVQAFESAGLPVLVLKGAALADWVYPEAALRPMSDLDLLAPQERLEEAIGVIEAAGYRKQKVTYHVVFYGGADGRITLELHWQLGYGGQPRAARADEWFWGQAVQHPEGGWRLPAGASILYLAGHLIFQHGESNPRLIWYYDLYRLVEQAGDEVDWQALFAAARELGWAGALWQALEGVRQRFDWTLPEGLPAVEQAEPARQQQAQLWMREALGGLPGRTRVRMLLGLVFPSAEYLRWRYRPRWEWLWPLCYPLRWLDLAREGLLLVVRKG